MTDEVKEQEKPQMQTEERKVAVSVAYVDSTS